MLYHTSNRTLLNILNRNQPQAIAQIQGSGAYPTLSGAVKFYNVPYRGILVEAELFRLPAGAQGDEDSFFGFHIHENGDCSGAFENSGGHYNPENTEHPFHAGDMPPLMSNNGYAWTAFFDSRISIPDILNKSVIIHRMPDDFTTQPSGNAGEKIACGIIMLTEM